MYRYAVTAVTGGDDSAGVDYPAAGAVGMNADGAVAGQFDEPGIAQGNRFSVAIDAAAAGAADGQVTGVDDG